MSTHQDSTNRGRALPCHQAWLARSIAMIADWRAAIGVMDGSHGLFKYHQSWSLNPFLLVLGQNYGSIKVPEDSSEIGSTKLVS